MKLEGSELKKDEIAFNSKEAEALIWCVTRKRWGIIRAPWWNVSDEDIAENTDLSIEEAHLFVEKAIMGGLVSVK